MKKVGGIIPALVTPFVTGGGVDLQAMSRLIGRLLDQGVGGFYLCGSTAECHLMSPEERKRVVEAAAKVVDGRVPLIIHVGTISTDIATDLARHAAASGADYVSAIPPFYYKFSLEEIKDYYRAIADAAGVPLFIYNFPALTGVAIGADNAADLLGDERVAGVKHTSQDLFQLQQMKSRFPQLILLNGFDEALLGGLSMGADGAIGSTYNFMAPRYIRLLAAFRAGDLPLASKLQAEANAIIKVLLDVGVYPGIKHILKRQGFDVGECRRPFRPLTADEKSRLDEISDGI
jgi:N-acetylneuraminate lyase